MQTVFKKVMVSDRSPSKEGYYLTDKGNVYFRDTFYTWIDWWLEEVELPSEDDIFKEGSKMAITSFRKGANYILNKLK